MYLTYLQKHLAAASAAAVSCTHLYVYKRQIYNNVLLAYACFGVAIAGLMYIILSSLFKIFGVKKVMRYFPPIVTCLLYTSRCV